MNRKIIITLLLVLTIYVSYFFAERISNTRFIKKTWKISMPANSRLIRLEKEFGDFDGAGHCYAIFDITNASKDFAILMKKQKCKYSRADSLIFSYT
ncbi:hypothetical protein [Pedobacter agri]|uniref:hypothetical protein n=1 Tax=Pedobacter agri TaxID=454586 RepID=UPI0029308711|nr:hypothetical protein [Pedobacter agri]